MTGSPNTGGLSRRAVLTRGVAFGAAAWAAPSLVSRDVAIAFTVGDTICPVKPTCIRLTWLGPGWDSYSNATCPVPTGKVAAEPWFVPDTLSAAQAAVVQSDPVYIEAGRGGGSGNTNFNKTFSGCIVSGTSICIPVPETGGQDLKIFFGTDPIKDRPRMGVHISCSQDICIGDVYGGFRIDGFCNDNPCGNSLSGPCL